MLSQLLVIGAFLSSAFGKDIHLIVQPTGSDNNDGLTHPLKTLEKAIARLDDVDVKGNRVFIELRKGYYDLSQTISLTKKYGFHVTIRSFYNKEQAHVVRQLRFADAGITVPQLGVTSRFGFYKSREAPMEIFYNSKPLRVARWPNDGSYINVVSVPDGREGKRFGYASTVGNRAEKWKQESDLWVYGFWYWSWADDAGKVASIDTSKRLITLETTTRYGFRTGHYQMGAHAGYSQQGGYFSVFNALSELDQPGEYYIDRTSGILYLWPPEHNGVVSTNDVIYGSMINTLFQMSGASNIVFQDLIFENTRHYGVDGSHLSSCSFERIEIRNTGSYGMHLSGSNVTIRQCDIHDTDGGLSINGGDRRTLTSSGHVIENNRIFEFSRVTAVGMHGVNIAGVGITIQHNEISHGPYTGIMWKGNDHVIRRNHLHNLCTGTSDCGAIHSGRDWTFRGNVIKENHIHHVLRFLPGAEVRGVMLDDQYSSVLIEGNVFYENEVHFNIGGGRDNIARYNVFLNPHSTVIDVDGRGINGHSNDKTLHDTLVALPYKTGIWAQKYPALARIDQGHPGAPEGNQIYKNMIIRGSRHLINYHGAFLQKTEYFNLHDNYETDHVNEFNNFHAGDFRFVCGAGDWAQQKGVPQPPTMADVGPHLPVGPSYKGSESV
ncbi:uncharacterized protein LOC135477056 [Liolophura sinensis]|uniref:uncharacterized protein LOC135477056 n=1 Tax=Liolophura sinensis TaxID=3198878 RepID=UPI0031589458